MVRPVIVLLLLINALKIKEQNMVAAELTQISFSPVLRSSPNESSLRVTQSSFDVEIINIAKNLNFIAMDEGNSGEDPRTTTDNPFRTTTNYRTTTTSSSTTSCKTICQSYKFY